MHESELFHEGISKGEDELEIRFLADHSEYKVEVEVEYLPKSLKVKVYRKHPEDRKFQRINTLPDVMKNAVTFREKLDQLSTLVESIKNDNFKTLFGE